MRRHYDDSSYMEPQVYFKHICKGLESTYGASIVRGHVTRFGDIGLEHECIGSILLIFISKLDWMQAVQWEGAVHLDTRSLPMPEAVASVQRMIETGRRRLANR